MIFIPTFLPSSTFALVCLSLSFSLSPIFLIHAKTARRVGQYSRRVVSFRLFRSRRGSVSLCALLIFLPLHRIRLCVYDCVCARFAWCMSAIDSLQTHAHLRTHSHIETMGREAHREGGWKNDSEWEREKEDHLIYVDAQDGCYAVCGIYNCWGQIGSRISFRSDDDNDDVPPSSISTQLRRYGFSSSISPLHGLSCRCLSFLLIGTTATITLRGFFANIWMRMHLQRPWKCAMLHCHGWSIGRSSARVWVHDQR